MTDESNLEVKQQEHKLILLRKPCNRYENITNYLFTQEGIQNRYPRISLL